MLPPSHPARITKESIASYCLNKCTENYVHLIQISRICISALPIRYNNTFIFANAVRNGKNQKLPDNEQHFFYINSSLTHLQ